MFLWSCSPSEARQAATLLRPRALEETPWAVPLATFAHRDAPETLYAGAKHGLGSRFRKFKLGLEAPGFPECRRLQVHTEARTCASQRRRVALL